MFPQTYRHSRLAVVFDDLQTWLQTRSRQSCFDQIRTRLLQSGALLLGRKPDLTKFHDNHYGNGDDHPSP